MYNLPIHFVWVVKLHQCNIATEVAVFVYAKLPLSVCMSNDRTDRTLSVLTHDDK